MKFLLDQVIAAYSGYIKWAGIIVGSFAILNWFVITLDLSVIGLLSTLLELYENTFYPIFLIPEYFFGVDLPDRIKDSILLYFVLGGVTCRTWHGLVKRTDKAENATIGDYSEPVGLQLMIDSKNRAAKFVFLFFAYLFWPSLTFPFFKRSIMVFKKGHLELWLPASGPTLTLVSHV